jgi:hypothetical protein
MEDLPPVGAEYLFIGAVRDHRCYTGFSHNRVRKFWRKENGEALHRRES